MHPKIEKMMKPFYDRGLTLSLNFLVRKAGLQSINDLPRHPDQRRVCLRWVLGSCRVDGNNQCGFGNVVHLTSRQIPDSYADQLINKLQPGVDRLVKEYDAGTSNKRPRG